jgi:hypothetical protein
VIETTVNFARMQTQERDLTVQKIRLSGGGARLRGLRDYLQSATGVEVESLDPFARVGVARSVEGPDGWRDAPSDFACALGLALIAGDEHAVPRISVGPALVAQARTRQRWRPVWIGFAAGLFLTLAATMLAFARARAASRQAEAMENAIARAQERAGEFGKAREAIQHVREAIEGSEGRPGRALRKYVEPTVVLLETVARLQGGLPQGVSLTRIAIRETGGDPAAGDDAAERIVVVGGEAYVRGEEDPRDRLARMLADPARRWTAGVQDRGPVGDKPGWRRFEIEIRPEPGR